MQKTNLFVSVEKDGYKGMGEVAPNIRYGEDPELIKSQFENFIENIPSGLNSLQELQMVFKSLKICHSLQFGLESSFIHYMSLKNNKPVYEYLGIPAPGPIYTSYTLPIMEPGLIKDFLEKLQLKRFKSLKIKINSAEGLDIIKEVAKCSPLPLRVDANEGWRDVENLIQFTESLKKYNIEFLEQPLPADFNEEYIYLKKYSLLELMADESITNEGNFYILAQQFHGINMKLMKAGGYINGLNILNEARKHGLKTMIGCMIETTLGISSAMNICHNINYIDLDGYFIIKNEPFKLANEKNGRLYFFNN
ncbi:MAG TPA: enolase C-terminal domain-like protein [Cytophagaceae bacterium]|nr:enolase C-terminal domain-like protein [Cytophagaceae bacterium]